ncbi:MAG TPA: hypothetical protein VGN20_24740 [Mucilaginibacter sp.]|jgi:hypothetical protein
MKNKICLLILFASVLIQACKKDSKQNPQPTKTTTASLGSGLLSFSIGNQVINSIIDTSSNVINAVVVDDADYHHMVINFILAANVTATVNGAVVNSGATVDMSKLFYFKISSADGKRSSAFLVNQQRELNYWGLPGNLISGKSLNRSYNFYFDQFAGTTSDNINCALATSTMAIKWADSTFTKTVVDARSMYLTAGEWSDRNMSDYMNYYGISHEVDSVEDKTNIDSLVKTNIDNNRIMIFLVNMYYLTYNSSTYEHVNSFWLESFTGFGHCLLVKGYKQMSDRLYLETYDPYSAHNVYVPGVIAQEPIGQDRYYSSADIKNATAIYSTEAFVIAPKGQQVPHPIISVSRLKNLHTIR